MSLRVRVYHCIDIILRVPPLFVIDELLKIGLGLPQLETNSSVTYQNSTIGDEIISEANQQNDYADVVHYDSQFYKVILYTLIKFILSCFGVVCAMGVFILWTKQLVVVYMYLMSVGVVFVSYWANVSTMKAVINSLNGSSDTSGTSLLEDLLSLNLSRLLDPLGPGYIIAQNYALQCVLSISFVYIHQGPKYHWLQKMLPFSFAMPSVLAVLPLPTFILYHAPVFAALMPLAIVKFVLWSSAVTVVQSIYSGYQFARNFISNFGLSNFVETEWARLNVPTVLKTFWILRVTEHIGFLMMGYINKENIGTLFEMTKYVLVTGCETLTAVLGMTSIVSHVCHYIGCFFQWVLLIEEDDDRSIGTVSAILFYILALQTGLTGLNPEKRFVRLFRNFCLLFTALLHFVHNIVNPLLMSLSASHNPSTHRHIRALGVCAFLVIFPIALLSYLWTQHSISTWLLAVSAFSIEVIVKVVVSLMIYGLFLIDAYRSTFWEKLDDYVYYIRAFGNTVEFCFGIFLFFNGGWILVFESGGAIRAVMMCIHAYFNIWCEARAGWSVFMKRRTAVNKIDSLPEASSFQLRTLDDVCAICYQEMSSAKITKCNHYFHGVCLRKWLYVQDRCPLCHDILYKIDNDNAKENSNEGEPVETVARNSNNNVASFSGNRDTSVLGSFSANEGESSEPVQDRASDEGTNDQINESQVSNRTTEEQQSEIPQIAR